MEAEVVGVARGDVGQRLGSAKVLDEIALRPLQVLARCRLHVGPPLDVSRQERAERRLLGRGFLRHEPDVGELVVEQRLELAHPSGRLSVPAGLRDRRGIQRFRLRLDRVGGFLGDLAQSYRAALAIAGDELDRSVAGLVF
ncbi:hypothetical protein [Lacipirellula parvula]|uniref:hypothetical protein n=1 Tax=Lacipirellula parvula TaxID=2650471 RepID=UPI001E568E1C|nr:hypothetical protein [Lacipirellula parvula]